MDPSAAYHCESCPLPAAHPGFELAAVWHVFQELARWPLDHPVTRARWAELIEIEGPSGEVIEDMETIRDAVSSAVKRLKPVDHVQALEREFSRRRYGGNQSRR